MDDLISRQAAIDEVWNITKIVPTMAIRAKDALKAIPSAQQEIIRCRDCRWWDKYSVTHGYCMAAKHGYWSEHWEITIRRSYDADWFCADAEKENV